MFIVHAQKQTMHAERKAPEEHLLGHLSSGEVDVEGPAGATIISDHDLIEQALITGDCTCRLLSYLCLFFSFYHSSCPLSTYTTTTRLITSKLRACTVETMTDNLPMPAIPACNCVSLACRSVAREEE